MEEGGRAAKRPRLGSEERSEGASTTLPVAEAVKHLLYVQWFGTAGQSKLNKLQLRRLDDLEALQALPKELLQSQYPTADQLPDYCTNAAYTRFTPAVECLALPGDVVRTEARLVLSYQGWEWTLLKKDSAVSERQPGAGNMQVMAAEFLGSDPLMAALGLRMALIAYPIVALDKAFLDEAHARLLAAPDSFRGLLC